ncbi:branched-chain amino acid ABC transporter permease [Haladaptatus pallidirubidus]|uniref:Branched-chain amino acid ABC transporter permease n=1 Tax=Haladaptatus pallidirubidus TaxID=1008152 RepID=A0AAV3UNQ6_9EURY|nr:branched-chain amino acid ABC transporter permease [Haladaptatus pallidirubidus]
MTDEPRTNETIKRTENRFDVSSIRRFSVPIGLFLIVVLLRPLVSHPLVLGYGQIATTMLIWMLFVASFNLLLGYTGILSFGHAIFLGAGAYGVAIGIAKFSAPYAIAAPVAIAVAGVIAYLIARLIVHKGEIYFAMLTLAFAKSVHFIANYNPEDLTGGAQGLSGDTLPAFIQTYRGQMLVNLGGFSVNWYYVVGLVFFVSMLALWQVVRSPFGRSLVAIRENEELARAMGMNTRRYKVWAFTLSGVFAGLAGALIEINDQGATLSLLSVQTSGDAILMTVLGGANYFFGPLAGVFMWLFAEDYLTNFETLYLPLAEFPVVGVELSGVLAYWRFLLGFLFVIAVLVSPREGLWGLTKSVIESAYNWLRSFQ